MAPDPRLNSVHLNPPRREKYRQAKRRILQACGNHTLCGDPHFHEPLNSSCTIVQGPAEDVPPSVECWLVDEDFIYPLKVGLNTIGRAPENDVVVRDGYVSRRHCAIVVHSDFRCEIYDTASKNGTILNGSQIHMPTRLQSGDQILMCDCTLTFMSRHGAPEDASAGAPTLGR